MRVVLDTNVLISAILFGGPPRELLQHAIQGRLQPVTSARLLDELEELLEGKFGFSPVAAAETRSEFEVLAEVVEPVEVPKVCRDPDDDEVLVAAVLGGAAVIVTGDRDLLDLGTHQGIEIQLPGVFVRRIGDVEG